MNDNPPPAVNPSPQSFNIFLRAVQPQQSHRNFANNAPQPNQPARIGMD